MWQNHCFPSIAMFLLPLYRPRDCFGFLLSLQNLNLKPVPVSTNRIGPWCLLLLLLRSLLQMWTTYHVLYLFPSHVICCQAFIAFVEMFL